MASEGLARPDAAVRAGGRGSHVAIASLFDHCIAAAASSSLWRLQRRSVERLPEHAANALLQRLVQQQALGGAPQLELWGSCVTVVDLSGVPGVSAEHLAYLSEFRELRQLRLARCPKLRDAHLAPLSHLGHSLTLLDVRGCQALTGRTLELLQHLPLLTHLDLSGTSAAAPDMHALSQLTRLTFLGLAQLALSDECAAHMRALTRLRHLDCHAAHGLSDNGLLCMEPAVAGLTYLDVAWTGVTLLPLLPCLQVLHMEHCHIQGTWELQPADSHKQQAQQQQHHQFHNSSAPRSQHHQTHHHHHHHDHDSHYSGSGRGHQGVRASHTFSHRGSHTQGLPLQQLHLGGCSLGPAALTSGEGGDDSGGNGAVHRVLRACARSLRMADLQGVKSFSFDCWPQLDTASLDPSHADADSDPSALPPCLESLTALDLRGTSVGCDVVQVLHVAAPQLRCLLLAGCEGLAAAAQLPGWCLPPPYSCPYSATPSSCGMTRLKKLDLSGCGITDAHLPSLLQLSSLQHLDLSRNPLTAQPPAAVDDAPQAGRELEGPAALRQGGGQQGQGGGRARGEQEERGQGEERGRAEEGGQALPWWAQPPAFPGLSHAEAQEQMEAVWRNPDVPQPSLGSRAGTGGTAGAVHASRGRDGRGGDGGGGGGEAVIGSTGRDGSGSGGDSDGGGSGAGAALAGVASAEGEGEAGACVGGRGDDPQAYAAWGGLPRLTSLSLRDTEVNASGIRALAPLAHTLTHLDLGHANLTGDALRHVTSLTSLRTLCLSGSPLLTGHCVARVVRALLLLVRVEVPGCWLVPKAELLGLMRRGSSGAVGAGSKAAAAAAVAGGAGLGTAAGNRRAAVGAAGATAGAEQAAGGQLLAAVAPDGELLLFAEVAAAAAAAGVVAAAALSSGKAALLGVPGSLATVSGAATRGSSRPHNSRSGAAGVAGVAAQTSAQQLEQYDERCRYTKQQLLDLRPPGSPPMPFETTSESDSQASAYTALPDCGAASCDAGRACGAASAGVARSSSDEGHVSAQMLQMLSSTSSCPGGGGDGSQDSAVVRQAVASAAAELLR